MLSASISIYSQTMTQTVHLRTSRNETQEPKPTETWSKATRTLDRPATGVGDAIRGQYWQGDP